MNQAQETEDSTDVVTTAAHILVLLDSVEQQLATIRSSAQKLIKKDQDDTQS